MTAYTKTWWFRLPFLGGCFGRILNQIWLAKESAPSIRWVKFAVQWALFMQLDVFPITISKGDEKIICIILQIMRRKFSNFLHLWWGGTCTIHIIKLPWSSIENKRFWTKKLKSYVLSLFERISCSVKAEVHYLHVYKYSYLLRITINVVW